MPHEDAAMDSFPSVDIGFHHAVDAGGGVTAFYSKGR